MARPRTGQIVTRQRKDGITYGLRFRDESGRFYVTLGRASDGWTRQRAEIYLRMLLADIREGRRKPEAQLRAERKRTPRRPLSDPVGRSHEHVRKLAQSLDAVQSTTESAIARQAARDALARVHEAEEAVKHMVRLAT